MQLKTSYYNSGTGTHSALAIESEFLSYAPVHQFYESALVVIELADPTGLIMQKYDVAENSVYVGPGRVIIQDPTPDPDDDVSNLVFDGRIVKARHDSGNHRAILMCQDWLSQLDEERIKYDMREDLNGSGLMESTVLSDTDSGTESQRAPAFTSSGVAVGGAVSRDGEVTANDTTDANDAGTNDMELLPSPVMANGDGYYFGHSSKFGKISINIGTAGFYVGSISWKYYNGTSWVALPDVVDKTEHFEVAGTNSVTFNIPADWALTTLEGMNLYWVFACLVGHGGSATSPLGTQAWIHTTHYVWDDAMSGIWGDNDWNGYYFILPIGVAGSQKISVGPHSISLSRVLDTSPLVTDGEYCWVDDDNYLLAADDDGLFYLYSMHKTRVTEGSLYDEGSLSAVRVRITYSQVDGFADSYIYVRDVNEATLYEIGRLRNNLTTESIVKTSFEVPLSLASSILEADGSVDIAFRIEGAVDTTCTFKVRHLKFEMDLDTEGYGYAIAILDTVGNPARLTVGKDLGIDGLGIWDGAQYCIAREIHYRINGLVTGGDNLMTMTTDVESTSGISTRRYNDRTRLEIIQDVAKKDKAVCWCPLGTKQLKYKSTFTGTPTAMTDADVLGWSGGEYDYVPMFNEFHIGGIRIGDNRLYTETEDMPLVSDPGADSKTKYGATRTKVIASTGTMTQHDTESLGRALVEANEDVNLFLECTIAGLSSFRLGDEVSITSTYLGLTSEEYVVSKFSYNSKTHRSQLALHPRTSQGFVDRVPYGEHLRHIGRQTEETVIDTFIPGVIP